MRSRIVLAVFILVAAACSSAFAENLVSLQGSYAPLGMNNKCLGGAYSEAGLSIWDYIPHKIPGDGVEWQWTKASGCPTTGLLVKTWGTVKNTFYSPTTGAKWFHIDDGSRVTSDLTDTGVIVYSDADVKRGQFVAVTGISATEPAIDMPDKLIRTLHVRTADDVQVLREPKPDYPFSDEFNGPNLDWRWSKISKQLVAGLPQSGLESGCLKIHLPASQTNNYAASPHFVQYVQGDWDMEVKLKLEPTYGYMVWQGIGVALKDTAAEQVLPIVNAPTGQEYNWLAAKFSQQASPDPDSAKMMHMAADMPLEYFQPMDSQAEWAWFRVRKRAGIIYGSGSTDGINYTPEYSKPCQQRCWVAICAYSWSHLVTPGPMTGYIDYIRITLVSD